MKSKSIRNNEKSQIELWKIAVQYVHNLPAYLLILVTLGYVLISSSVNCSSTSGEALFFKLQPVDSLLSSCSVCVEITLVNTSGSTIVLYHWKHRQSGLKGAIGYYLNFHITNNNQDTASESVIILRPKLPHRSDTLQLKPGEEYKQIINLTPYYSIIGDTIISNSSY